MRHLSHAFAIALAGALGLTLPAAAAPFASSVVSYQPGTIRSDYRLQDSALGSPASFTASSPFSQAMVVTPFNAPYAPSELTGVGVGGRLVLELGQIAETGRGHTLGVHAGVNLGNVGGASGAAGNPAVAFNDRQADVRVSF